MRSRQADRIGWIRPVLRITNGSAVRFKVGTEVNYGVHKQSEALFHVPTQSIDKPWSTVTEGEDVLSQQPAPVPGRLLGGR